MAKKTHVCNTCCKAYSRAEHLQRHADSHKNVKPWHCQFCSKYFVRRDVLNRHFKSCVPAARGARAQGGRVNRACQNCKERKVKCSGGQPCTLCAKYPVACIYTYHGAAPYMRRSSTGATDSQMAVADGGNEFQSDQYHQRQNSGQGSFSKTGEIPLPYEARMCLQNKSVMNRSISDLSLIQSSPTRATTFNTNGDRKVSSRDGWNSSGGFGAFDWFFLDTQQALTDPTMFHHRTKSSADHSGSEAIRTPSSAFEGLTIENRSPLSLTPPTRLRVDMAQINPLEHHRTKILRFLEKFDGIQPQHVQWLTLESMGTLLETYFLLHNQHTPIIHLPRWSVATCETPLIFSIILVGLSCVPDAWAGLDDAGILLTAAYFFAIQSMDQDKKQPMTLETLQALVFLAIVDRLILNGRKPQSQIEVSHIIVLARTGKFFKEDDKSSPSTVYGTPWQVWAHSESRRRTAFVLYSFDAFVSCLEDRRPHIEITEMGLRMPSPENMFLAESAEDWAIIHSSTAGTDSLSFSAILSILLSDFSLQVELPPTLMGGFALLHGLLAYVMETRKTYRNDLDKCTSVTQELVNAFVKKRNDTIQRALEVWCRSWLETLEHPLCSASESHGLYRDRALIYWYLTGILTLPESNSGASMSPRCEDKGSSFRDLLQQLILTYDKGQLSTCAGDFAAARQLVRRGSNPETRRISIGSLLYKESDAERREIPRNVEGLKA